MENPFEIINERLERIEKLLENIYTGNGKNENSVIIHKIMNAKQLSIYLGLSISHIYKLTSTNNIPHSKRGKKLYFDKETINTWVLENKIWTQVDIEKEAANYLIKHPNTFR